MPVKIQDLPVRNADHVRGGFGMLGYAVSAVNKAVGSALQTAARNG
jgi:hypothetical protein